MATDPGSFLQKLCRGARDQELLADALDQLANVLDCERIFLFQVRSHGEVRVTLTRSRDRERVSDPLSKLSHFAIRKAIRAGRPFHVPDALRDRRYRPQEVLEGRRPPSSIIVLPVFVEGQLYGGVYADQRLGEVRGDEESLRGADLWIQLLSVVLGLRRLHRDLRVAQRKATLRRVISEESETSRGEKPARRGARAEPTGGAQEAADGALVWFGGCLSANPDMRDLFDSLRSLKDSDLPMLICGESGTGKSLLAQALHASSSRREQPFLTFGSTGVPETLIESELWGHVRGAYTGAEVDRDGVFKLADRGTLLLDEVGDMSHPVQTKLLRVLEDGRVRPLGAKDSIRVDVRVLASTSVDLDDLILQGRFRRDLYYRLKGIVLEIPPLRERREDILPLAEHFLQKHAAAEGRRVPELDAAARGALRGHSWPGNVRELENEMRRLVALGRDRVGASNLSQSLRKREKAQGGGDTAADNLTSIDVAVARAEQRAIQSALGIAGGNKSEAARLLGITRKALYRRLSKYGIG